MGQGLSRVVLGVLEAGRTRERDGELMGHTERAVASLQEKEKFEA